MKRRSLRLEVHEHKSLLMEQDQTVDIECQTNEHHKKLKPTTLTANLSIRDEIEIDSALENVTDLNDQQPSVNFDLELIPSGNSDAGSTQIAEHGQAYNLKLTIHEPIKRRFRVQSCFARSLEKKVELISSNGCSPDKSLLNDFEYEEQSATAKIPEMFRFVGSHSMTFECALKICIENEECKPNCMLKLDDPIGEDPELVSKLLRSSLSNDEDLVSSGHSPPPFNKNIASMVIHVVERREISESVPPTEMTEPNTERVSITGCRCDFPTDLVLLYKLCIGLSLLFALGCCCNVMFCCLNVRGKNATKKRRSVPKTIAQSTLTRNQYWINEPVGTAQNGTAFEEFPPSQYTEMQAPVITDTYATLRPRNKNSIEHPVSLIGFQPNGQPTSGFQYDTNATSVMSALSNYNNNRSSPPRSSTYEVPNRTFHSASNSECTASPRNSFDNSTINHQTNSINNALINSTTSANTAPTITNDSPQQQFLTLANENPQAKETYSIL